VSFGAAPGGAAAVGAGFSFGGVAAGSAPAFGAAAGAGVSFGAPASAPSFGVPAAGGFNFAAFTQPKDAGSTAAAKLSCAPLPAPVQVALNEEVPEIDAETSEYFFARVGEVVAPSSTPPDGDGCVKLLAISNKYGHTFFADGKGVRAAPTRQLLQRAKTLADKMSEQLEVAQQQVDSAATALEDAIDAGKPETEVAALRATWQAVAEAAQAISSGEPELTPGELATTAMEGVRLVVLSPEEQEVAVCVAEEARFYSAEALLAGGAEPVSTSSFDAPVRQLEWRPGQKGVCLVLLESGELLELQSGTDQRRPLADKVSAAGWSADGKQVAYGWQAELTVAPAEGSEGAFKCSLAEVDDLPARVDSVRWVGASSVLVGSALVSEGEWGSEEEDCPLWLVSWEQDEVPGEVQVQKFGDACLAIEADATPPASGPYLHAVDVQQWGVTVVAHRKSTDEHVYLLSCAPDRPAMLEIEDDRQWFRLPVSQSDEPDCIVGLALDLTSDWLAVPDPSSADRAALPASPVLVALTAAGKLCALTLGCYDAVRYGGGLVRAPGSLGAEESDATAAVPRKRAEKATAVPTGGGAAKPAGDTGGGGWGATFLAQNKAQGEAAKKAIEEEIKKAEGGGSTPSGGGTTFSFAAPAAGGSFGAPGAETGGVSFGAAPGGAAAVGAGFSFGGVAAGSAPAFGAAAGAGVSFGAPASAPSFGVPAAGGFNFASHGEAPSAVPAPADSTFQPCAAFQGARDKFYFGTTEKGTGYHADPHQKGALQHSTTATKPTVEKAAMPPLMAAPPSGFPVATSAMSATTSSKVETAKPPPLVGAPPGGFQVPTASLDSAASPGTEKAKTPSFVGLPARGFEARADALGGASAAQIASLPSLPPTRQKSKLGRMEGLKGEGGVLIKAIEDDMEDALQSVEEWAFHTDQLMKELTGKQSMKKNIDKLTDSLQQLGEGWEGVLETVHGCRLQYFEVQENMERQEILQAQAAIDIEKNKQEKDVHASQPLTSGLDKELVEYHDTLYQQHNDLLERIADLETHIQFLEATQAQSKEPKAKHKGPTLNSYATLNALFDTVNQQLAAATQQTVNIAMLSGKLKVCSTDVCTLPSSASKVSPGSRKLLLSAKTIADSPATSTRSPQPSGGQLQSAVQARVGSASRVTAVSNSPAPSASPSMRTFKPKDLIQQRQRAETGSPGAGLRLGGVAHTGTKEGSRKAAPAEKKDSGLPSFPSFGNLPATGQTKFEFAAPASSPASAANKTSSASLSFGEGLKSFASSAEPSPVHFGFGTGTEGPKAEKAKAPPLVAAPPGGFQIPAAALGGAGKAEAPKAEKAKAPPLVAAPPGGFGVPASVLGTAVSSITESSLKSAETAASSSSTVGVPSLSSSSTPALSFNLAGSTSSAASTSTTSTQPPLFGASSAGETSQSKPTGLSGFGAASLISGSTPALGANTALAFGATSSATATPSAFDVSTATVPSTPAFGAPSVPVLGATTSSTTSTPAFGVSSTAMFGAVASAPASGSVLGEASSPAPAGGLFGNPLAASTAASVFAAPPASAAFGNSSVSAAALATTPPASAAAFGSSSSAASGFGSLASSTPTFGTPGSNAFAAKASLSAGAEAAFGQAASPAASPFQSASTAALQFGASPAPAGAFGVPPTPSVGATPFGQAASSSVGSDLSGALGGFGLGGGGVAPTTPSSSFLSAQASTPFGVASSPQQSSSGPFGIKPATFAPPASGGAFGQPAAHGGGAFGSTSSPAASPFGQAATPGSTGFGAHAMGGGGFGQAATPGFGQAASPGVGSAFGSPAKPAAAFAAPAAPSAGGFAAATTLSGGFGALAAGSQQGAFGAPASGAGGLFGAAGNSAAAGGGFAAAAMPGAGGGFAAAAAAPNGFGQAAAPGAGFGAGAVGAAGGTFGQPPAPGGAFGRGAGAPQSPLFTQMRR